MDHLSVEIRNSLSKWYGSDNSSKINRVESFEIAEYGHQPDDSEIRRLFPMLGDLARISHK